MRNTPEALYAAEGMRRRRVLTDDDYSASTIYILPENYIVETTPGASGVIGLTLPKLCDCRMGALYTVTHHGTTANTTVDDQNDGLIALGQSVLTADADVVVFQHCGTHWLLIHDVTT